MLKRYVQLPVILVLALTAVLIVWLVSANRPEILPATSSEPTSFNPLSVSQDGSQTTTNVSGADLQQAAPPSLSASSTNTNPQQSSVNYCSAYENPTDGCLPAAQ